MSLSRRNGRRRDPNGSYDSLSFEAPGPTIERSNEPPALLLEKPRERNWMWVCSALWAKSDSGARAHLNIPDTVMLRHGDLAEWIFTGRNGEVMRKAQRNCTVDRVMQTFTVAALSNRDNMHGAVAIVGEVGGELKVVDENDFEELLHGIPSHAEFIQAYVPPRGALGPQSIANFRGEYKLQMNGRVQMSVCRIENSQHPDGFSAPCRGAGGASGVMRSMNPQINSHVGEQTCRSKSG